MRLLRFNYNTGKAEPIDLTGCKLNFRIYRPRFDVDLPLMHNASGREFKTTISLTEQESVALSRMSTDAERQVFLSTLVSAQAALQQLAIEAGLTKSTSQ